MVELRLEQRALLFKKVLEVFSDMFSEATFDFSGEGLELQATDTNGVVAVVLRLGPAAFDSYSCDSHLFMDLNLDGMAKVFRGANDDGTFCIKREEDFSLSEILLQITFVSPKVPYPMTTDIGFASVECLPLKIPQYPDSKYQAIVRLPSETFMRICNWGGSSGDNNFVLYITVDEYGLMFYAKEKTGMSTGNLTWLCRKNAHPHECIIQTNEKLNLAFALWYIKSFSKAYTLSHEVTIRLSSEVPAVFKYTFEEGHIRYHMLPMIDEDEQ